MLVRELGAGRNRAVDALLRDAFAEVGGSGERARAWSRFARRWPVAPQRELLERYGAIDVPVLLLWAEDDRRAPAERAREALARLPHGQLRTLPGAGFLMAYDDPVGVARELIAFCG
jgi:pimeloyl-ACP methyl ester carboxylesterase